MSKTPSSATHVNSGGAFSVTQFCKAHQISRGGFYNLIARGDGPRVLKVGRRTLISFEAAEAWRNQVTPEAISDMKGGRV